jgi:hypothetical protein
LGLSFRASRQTSASSPFQRLPADAGTGAVYRKLPHGPCPKDAEKLIERMEKAGIVKEIKVPVGNYAQHRLITLAAKYWPVSHADRSRANGSARLKRAAHDFEGRGAVEPVLE